MPKANNRVPTPTVPPKYQPILTTEISKNALTTATGWLDIFCKDGSWESAKSFRKPARPQQGRLRNSEGNLVSSDERAETLAQHLENIQWAVRPGTSVDEKPALWEELSVSCEDITKKEVKKQQKGKKNDVWIEED